MNPRPWSIVLFAAAVIAGCSAPGGSAPALGTGAGALGLAVANATSPPQHHGPRFLPTPGETWQWQLSGTVKPIPTGSPSAHMYDIDMFNNTAATVAQLHATGSKVICYIDAGSWENWRPDASKFPQSVLGKPLDGFPDERWLDIRKVSILSPIMQSRMDSCVQKGFDGIEFDNVDGYANASGFPLTSSDQLHFNEWLAAQAHARNMSVALKNDTAQVPQLVWFFDYALVEQCFEFTECDAYVPFINHNKPVFETEYNEYNAAFCPPLTKLRFSAMRKTLDLGSWRNPCWK